MSLELVMDMGAWRAVIHVVAKSQKELSDSTELNIYFYGLLSIYLSVSLSFVSLENPG